MSEFQLLHAIRLDIFLAVLIAAVMAKLYLRSRRGSHLPPGPPTTPFIGNLLSLSQSTPYIQYGIWAQQYGEIFSLKAGPSGTIVVMNSPQAIHEIMEKQGMASAGRPHQVVGERCTGGFMVGMNQPNHYWKRARRAVAEMTKPEECSKHLLIQIAESNQLMFDAMNSPQHIFTHIRRYGASVMLSIVFGQRAPRMSSPAITAIFELAHKLALIMEPGAAPPLELFPFLKWVPKIWAPWKSHCDGVYAGQKQLYYRLATEAQAREKRGEGNGCYMETLLRKAKELDLSSDQIGGISASLMNASSTTSSIIIQFMTLIVTAYPDVQRKAQEEIDRVVGRDRAPEYSDLESLPYIRALVKEVHRFRVVVPLSVPHRATSDIQYKQYTIPEGSVLSPNIWGVYHDEKLFEYPDRFYPERFLTSKSGLRKEAAEFESHEAFQRLMTYPYGCGRRACPGMALAEQAININAMNLLWAFNFKKMRADDGTEIEPDLWNFTLGTTHEPRPFVVDISPRSLAHAELVRKQFLGSAETFQKYERELDVEDRLHVQEQRGSHSIVPQDLV